MSDTPRPPRLPRCEWCDHPGCLYGTRVCAERQAAAEGRRMENHLPTSVRNAALASLNARRRYYTEPASHDLIVAMAQADDDLNEAISAAAAAGRIPHA